MRKADIRKLVMSFDSCINTVICGDNMEVMKDWPDNCVDTVIVDPPYGLGFMGKEWDTFKQDNVNKTKSYKLTYKTDYKDGVPIKRKKAEMVTRDSGARRAGSYDHSRNAEFQQWFTQWAVEVLRIAKPGAMMLCFGGTRTYHRLTCAIEDAGWQIRDCLMWLYGSGFPKSLDISKAIDKHGGKSIGWFGQWLRQWREENNITQKEIAKLFLSKTGGLTGCVANWELGLNMPTCEQFNLICKTFNLPFKSIEEAKREIATKEKSDIFGEFTEEQKNKFGASSIYGSEIYHNRKENKLLDVTNPATDLAKLWNGYGTALKPAWEPIVLAMKPLDGTFAANAEKWSVAGLNIDGGQFLCRKRVH